MPYGTKSSETVARYAVEALRFLYSTMQKNKSNVEFLESMNNG